MVEEGFAPFDLDSLYREVVCKKAYSSKGVLGRKIFKTDSVALQKVIGGNDGESERQSFFRFIGGEDVGNRVTEPVPPGIEIDNVKPIFQSCKLRNKGFTDLGEHQELESASRIIHHRFGKLPIDLRRCLHLDDLNTHHGLKRFDTGQPSRMAVV